MHFWKNCNFLQDTDTCGRWSSLVSEEDFLFVKGVIFLWADDTWFSSLSLIGILQCGPLSQWAGVYKADKCGNLRMSLSEVSRGKALKAQTHTHNPSITGTSAKRSCFRFYQLFKDDRTPSFASVWKVYKKSAWDDFRTSGPCVPSAARTQSRPWQPSGSSSENEEPPPERTRSSHVSKKERKWC